MPYNPQLAERLASVLSGRSGMLEKKMFGGIGWLLNGNMCVGVYKDFLILRLGQEQASGVLKESHAKVMDITGKPMKGWVMVSPAGYSDHKNLQRYINLAINFVRSLPAK